LNKASYNGNKIKRPDLNFEEYNDTLRHIDDFENVLERAGEKNQPHIITGFLITLCGHFNSFYNKKRVLCEDKEERDSHVEFINVILLYIKKGLDILGIKIPEKM
jgi:arginyl-tRNA synthetase